MQPRVCALRGAGERLRPLHDDGARSIRVPTGRGYELPHHELMAIDGIDPMVAPSGSGCADCEAVRGWWFHLRRCAQCGRIGCCDSSPEQHASRHAREQHHPWIQSYEPGEDWYYNFDDQQTYQGPALAPPRHHPVDQAVPGPAGRVPADWQQLLH